MQNIVFFFKSSLEPERQKQINEWLDSLTDDQRQMVDEIVENQLDEEYFDDPH
jgi:FixJ family two-component response regulator